MLELDKTTSLISCTFGLNLMALVGGLEATMLWHRQGYLI